VGPYQSLNVAQYVGDDDDAVKRNLNTVERLAGRQVAVMSAEHGTATDWVVAAGLSRPADILLTDDSAIALLALAADCVPIALINQHTATIAVVHAGWRGIAAGVVSVAVDEFVSAGCLPESTTAIIGPSICGHCYEVGPEVVDAVSRTAPNAILDSSHVDLAQAVSDVLVTRGILVHRMTGCTYEDENLFSFRRARGSATGRGGLLVFRTGDVA